MFYNKKGKRNWTSSLYKTTISLPTRCIPLFARKYTANRLELTPRKIREEEQKQDIVY